MVSSRGMRPDSHLCHQDGPFGYPAIPLVAGLLFALDRWMARRLGASPGPMMTGCAPWGGSGR